MFQDPQSLVVGDSKRVYDNLDKEQPGDERFSALKAAIIKGKMKEIGARARWLPHDRNPADALTKFRGSHAIPLRPEATELERKAAAKQELGYVPRPKTGIQGSNRLNEIAEAQSRVLE